MTSHNETCTLPPGNATPLEDSIVIWFYEVKMLALEEILDRYGRLPYIGNIGDAERGLRHFMDYAKEHNDTEVEAVAETLLADERGRVLLQAIFGNSPYLSQLLRRQMPFFCHIMRVGFEVAFEEAMAEVKSCVASTIKRPELMACLRIGKQRVALLVALADLTEHWQLFQITHKLSDFAELALHCAADFLLSEAARLGDVRLFDPEHPSKHSGLIILALGKLGAHELNYSSDIDLIVFYDPTKVTYTGNKNVQHFFVKLTTDLIKMMQERTQDGYVFRTDLRLRPDPGSTPVAISVSGALFYYESMGQNWERAAMIKARAIAGDMESGEEFLKQLNPYIWRKYLDFAAIQDIHSIKRQIDSKQGNLPENMGGYNVKIGHGGIREIEFFVQTQQLIWGGRMPGLRTQATCDTLFALARMQKIKPDVADELSSIYAFLRKVEHRLQMVGDHQTHSLPKEDEKLEEIAKFLRYDSAQEFTKDLKLKLSIVQKYYAGLFRESPNLGSEGSLVFTGTENDPETVNTLERMGFSNGNVVAEIIRSWHHGRYRVMRAKQSRELLTELTPAILQAMTKTVNPDIAFIQFDKFLSKLPTGVQIFSLFNANPHLLDLIAEIMGSYPYLADNLSRKPMLLEFVLYPEFLKPIPDLESLKENLDSQLKHAKDYEDVLDSSRRWTHDKQFQVGVQFIKQIITLQQVRKCLSDIAEAVLSLLLIHVKQEFETRRGRVGEGQFSVLAMGKLGSRQLTFVSDMDLLFVFDALDMEAQSDGAEPLLTAHYYTRLARRFLSSFSAPTTEGKLYEVDLRLRPSGESAPIATNRASFEIYYDHQAWTWEYMALTRARVIAGDKELGGHLTKVIRKALSVPRDKTQLATDIVTMRKKIAQMHHTDNPWNVKYVAGGLVDLEFIAQYLQLLYAHEHPGILDTNTRRSLEKIGEAGLITPDEAKYLREAALFLMDIQSAQRLVYWDVNKVLQVPEGLKKVLTKAMNAESFDVINDRLLETQEQVKFYFTEFLEKNVPIKKEENDE